MSKIESLIRPIDSLLLSMPITLAEAAGADSEARIGELVHDTAVIVAEAADTERKARAWCDSLVAERSSDPEANVADDIEELLRRERETRALRQRFASVARRVLATRTSGTADHEAIADFATKMDDVFVTVMEIARDARWALMLMDAKRQPTQSGPILDTPGKVQAWFDAIESGT